MKFRADFRWIAIEGRGKRFRYADETSENAGALAGETRHAQGEPEFGAKARPGIAWDRDVIDVLDADAAGFKAVANRRDRKSGRIFHAIEALFLDGGHQAAIADESGRRVAVIRVDAENIHAWY